MGSCRQGEPVSAGPHLSLSTLHHTHQPLFTSVGINTPMANNTENFFFVINAEYYAGPMAAPCRGQSHVPAWLGCQSSSNRDTENQTVFFLLLLFFKSQRRKFASKLARGICSTWSKGFKLTVLKIPLVSHAFF